MFIDNNYKRILISFILMLLVLSGLLVFSIGLGTADSSSLDLATYRTVILSIRLPRILEAVMLGGALAVSGFLLQTFFGNPIAGPYVLGISSAAKLLVALVMVGSLTRKISLTSAMMVAAAFIGSILAMGFVLLLSTKVRSMSILVVCGIMIGYICSAITDFVVTFADDSNIVNLHNWSMGSFSGSSMDDVALILILVLLGLFCSFLLSKPIGAFQLGEAYAKNMGVNIKALRVALILLSSLLSATVAAFAGPVSFVGIALPHLMRLLFKTAKPLVMIPACFLGGAIVTLACDDIARSLFAPTEVSISSVTAVFLVPVVISMMVRKRKGQVG